jgi:hypothetical protein
MRCSAHQAKEYLHKTDHGIAGLELSGFRPGRDDFASNVAARHEWKRGTQDEPQLALTNLPVDRIDARGANPHIFAPPWARLLFYCRRSPMFAEVDLLGAFVPAIAASGLTPRRADARRHHQEGKPLHQKTACSLRNFTAA